MKPLASPAGRTALRSFLRRRPLIALDFDGTLVALRKHPDLVRLSANMLTLLQQLSTHMPVAVISGRSLKDLRAHIPEKKILLIGNHGLEGLPFSIALRRSQRRDNASNVLQIRALLRTLHSCPDCRLENKTFSATLHFPRESQRGALLRQLRRMHWKTASPPRLMNGRLCINVLPARALNKGSALKTLLTLTGRSCAIFIGDDTTDEDVFALNDRRILGITIGRSPSRASFALPSQRAVPQFLQTCLQSAGRQERTRKPPHRNRNRRVV
ncbi:MAG: trehalose-phosphatase [Candidatus Peribacteraceae bacterium]|nr:trehalose-phosphatase [Candidatus Peribacteraceae bacterium]